MAFVDHFKAIYTPIARARLQEVCPPDLLTSFPKIRADLHNFLQAEPTAQEIHKATMMLGPFKSPGPDGFSAKVVQDNWSYFGPVITKEVGEFFAIGHMKSNIARSNLVLIPKILEPAKVTDYRCHTP